MIEIIGYVLLGVVLHTMLGIVMWRHAMALPKSVFEHSPADLYFPLWYENYMSAYRSLDTYSPRERGMLAAFWLPMFVVVLAISIPIALFIIPVRSIGWVMKQIGRVCV